MNGTAPDALSPETKAAVTQLAKEILAGLPAPVVKQHDSSKLLPGNRLTLSLFSELRYALGTTGVTGEAPVQQLISTVKKDNAGKFTVEYEESALPTDATKYQLVYADGYSAPPVDIPAPAGGKVTISVPNGNNDPDPDTLLAVSLLAGTESILISFTSQR